MSEIEIIPEDGVVRTSETASPTIAPPITIDELKAVVAVLTDRVEVLTNAMVKLAQDADAAKDKVESSSRQLVSLMKKAKDIFDSSEETVAELKLKVGRAIHVNDQKVLSQFQKDLEAIGNIGSKG